MVFVPRGFIAKQMKNVETKNAKTICLELSIVKTKWCILFVYRPPNTGEKDFFMRFQLELIKYDVNMIISFLQMT